MLAKHIICPDYLEDIVVTPMTESFEYSLSFLPYHSSFGNYQSKKGLYLIGIGPKLT
jgi:hypothetical protein